MVDDGSAPGSPPSHPEDSARAVRDIPRCLHAQTQIRKVSWLYLAMVIALKHICNRVLALDWSRSREMFVHDAIKALRDAIAVYQQKYCRFTLFLFSFLICSLTQVHPGTRACQVDVHLCVTLREVQHCAAQLLHSANLCCANQIAALEAREANAVN